MQLPDTETCNKKFPAIQIVKSLCHVCGNVVLHLPHEINPKHECCNDISNQSRNLVGDTNSMRSAEDAIIRDLLESSQCVFDAIPPYIA